MSKNLTIKQERFINIYLETGNASEAYRQAYSCERMKETTVTVKASESLRNGKVAVRLGEIQRELKKTSDIRKESILEELASIAFADIRDYVKFDGKAVTFKSFDELTDKQARAIESIRKTRHGIELKLHGKGWSIERISKMLGFDSPTFNIDLELLSEGQLDQIIGGLTKKLSDE